MIPGIYTNLSNEDYHAADGISKSGLDDIAVNPAYYQMRRAAREAKQDDEKECFRVGRAAHVAVIEPDRFSKQYLVAKFDRKSRTAWSSLEAKNPDKTCITPSEYDDYMRMAEAVRKHPAAKEILQKGYAETSIFHTDEQTGELVKVRPDWFIEDVLADLKTTRERGAAAESFERACFSYRYFVQAPFYMDVAGDRLRRTFNSFVFIVVEKGSYQVAVYYADADMIRLGREEYRRNLDVYARCRRSGVWPGYNDGEIRPVSLPAWAKRQLDGANYDQSTNF